MNMKDRINYKNCMIKKCEQCKFYIKCFKEKKGRDFNVSKSNRQI